MKPVHFFWKRQREKKRLVEIFFQECGLQSKSKINISALEKIRKIASYNKRKGAVVDIPFATSPQLLKIIFPKTWHEVISDDKISDTKLALYRSWYARFFFKQPAQHGFALFESTCGIFKSLHVLGSKIAKQGGRLKSFCAIAVLWRNLAHSVNYCTLCDCKWFIICNEFKWFLKISIGRELKNTRLSGTNACSRRKKRVTRSRENTHCWAETELTARLFLIKSLQ